MSLIFSLFASATFASKPSLWSTEAISSAVLAAAP
jgi:hypothetical protein